MIYNFLNLKMAGILVGMAVLLSHAFALFKRKTVRDWLQVLPRSRPMGIFLLLLAATWTFALVATMDLGEFTRYRNIFLLVIPVGSFLAIRYVEEFLAVRAAGMLLLLAAEPVLEAAFLHPEKSRLLLVILAYGWIIIGLFWVGMPYLMRDQIQWLLKSEKRWDAAIYLGIAYGAAILGCALLFYAA